MENGRVECLEIVDYYPSSCVEDEVSETGEVEEGKSRLRWVIDAGFSLGKKLVITGVVITSAPLVLPPLLVVSALGCALSFPFGVVFASYACTQKLMSTLLPSPTTLLLPYDDSKEGEEEVFDMEEEEEEEREAMKDGIEARIELVDYNEGFDARDGYLEVVELNEGEIWEQDGEGYEKPRLDFAAEMDDYGGEMEFVEGQKNEDDSRNAADSQVEIDIFLENYGEKGISDKTERKDLLDDQNVTVESIEAKTNDYGGEMESKEEQNNVESSRNDVDSQVQIGTSFVNEGEKGISEKTEREDLLEDQNVTVESIEAKTDDYGEEMGSKEQNNMESSRNDVDSQVQIGTSFADEGEKGISEKTERKDYSKDQNATVESIAAKTDDYGGEMESKEQNNVESSRNDVDSQVEINPSLENEGEKGTSEKRGREDLLKQSITVESATVATVKVVDKDEKRRSGKRGKRKTSASLKFHGKNKEAEQDKRHEKLSREDKGLIAQEEAKDLSANKSSLGEKQSFPEANREELSVQKEKADEEKCIVLGGENLDVEQVSVRSKPDDDVVDIDSSLEKEGEPVGLKKISDVCIETNGETTTTYMSTTVAVASGSAKEDSTMIGDDDSAEVIHDDKEIWKKMEAIRVIVGFKAPRCDSYFEELKAMYVFTGIEPPSDLSAASSSPDSDADFQKKLCFLMSVIGLK